MKAPRDELGGPGSAYPGQGARLSTCETDANAEPLGTVDFREQRFTAGGNVTPILTRRHTSRSRRRRWTTEERQGSDHQAVQG